MMRAYILKGSGISAIGVAILSLELYGLEFLNVLQCINGRPVQFDSRFSYLSQPVILIAFLLDLVMIASGMIMIGIGCRGKKQ